MELVKKILKLVPMVFGCLLMKKGYFDFDFKNPFDNLELKKNDEISLTFAPDDEDEALKSLIFKTKVTSLEDIDKAETKYDHTKVEKVKVLKDVKEDLHVDEIYGSLYHTEQGKGILDKQELKKLQVRLNSRMQ